jgi:hypothetical protein
MKNDPKDRHVLAAAVASKAAVIVTANIRHFPKEVLEPFAVRALPPDTFLQDLLGLYPDRMLNVVEEMAARKRRPPHSVHAFAPFIAKHAPNFIAALTMIQEDRSLVT